MRIALNAWFWDQADVGSGQYLKYLLPALLQLDSKLEIILVSSRPPAVSPIDERLQFHIAPTPFRQQRSNLAKLWFEQIAFPRACRRLGVDLAHVPYFGSSLAPLVPTIVTIHDLIPMILPEYRAGLRARLYTSLVAAAASRASLILTDSNWSRRDILSKLAVSSEQTRVVYLAPAPHFQPNHSQQQLAAIRAKYGLPETFALYLGGYDIRKNVSALLHAFTWVKAAVGDLYPLVLAGRLPRQESQLYPDPLRLARQLELEECILTPGWIAEEDLPLLYAAATVFVYPSRYEGFGLPVLEAMACGTPVVTTNAASIPELAGSAAFQPDPDDTKHIAAPIIRLCTDPETNDEMAARGLERAEQFSWQKTAAETRQAYQDIL